jgi:hypothetical protein
MNDASAEDRGDVLMAGRLGQNTTATASRAMTANTMIGVRVTGGLLNIKD